jgi:acetylornithine deacetylase
MTGGDVLDEAVAAQAAWMEELLVELVAAPTMLGAEEAGQAVMARAFADCGLRPVDVPMDAAAIRADPRHSPFSWDVAGKRNVVATWAGDAPGDGRSLVLNGHVDVVPPAAAELWASDPFLPRRDGDWLYGRGAGDMKAGLVAMTGAVRALRACGVRLRGDLHLQSVVEEECTGNGTLGCLLAGHGDGADAAVLTEPHPDHLTLAQVGVVWFHVDVRGLPAHAARASALGRNAFDAAGRILEALRGLEGELNAERHAHPWYRGLDHPINLNPGIVSAGDWPSTVPAACTLSCRLGLYPGQEPADVLARVEETVARAAASDPFLVAHPPAVRLDGFRCEGSVVDEREPLVQALSAAYGGVHGTAPSLQATTATTDARHFVRRGTPAVCFGPRAEDIHGIDERVSLSSLADVARVLARFVLDWCGESTDVPAGARTQGGETDGNDS